MRAKWNKWLCIALACIMVTGMLAGCGASEQPAVEDQPKVESEAGDAETDETAEESAEEVKELRTVSVIGVDEPNAAREWWTVENFPEWEAGKVWNAKMESIGVELDIETIARDQYDEAMKTRQDAWLDMPDVIRAVGSYTDWIGYGQSGYIWNIKELLEQYDEDGSIWAYMEKIGGDAFNTILDENGDLWWFPYVLSQGVEGRPSSCFTLNLRADWLEKIGVEYKHFYTPEEILDILVKFQEEDVNENGVADEVIDINLASEWEPFSAAFGMGRGYIYALSDGSGVQCKLDHENFEEYIKYCQELYKAGVFNTEILNEGNNILESNCASAIFDYNGATYNEQAVTGYETTARYAPVFVDDDGGENGFIIAGADSPFAVMNGFLVNKDCKDPQAVVDLMDFVFSDECSDLFYYGVEGISWEYDPEVDGKVYIDVTSAYDGTAPETCPLNNVVGNNLVPSALNIVKSFKTWEAAQNREGYPEKDEFSLVALREANERNIPYYSGTQPFAMMSSAETEAYNAVATTVETYINELLIDLIIGNKSLDDMELYRAELKELGLDTMIEIRTAQNNRYMNAGN